MVYICYTKKIREEEKGQNDIGMRRVQTFIKLLFKKA